MLFKSISSTLRSIHGHAQLCLTQIRTAKTTLRSAPTGGRGSPGQGYGPKVKDGQLVGKNDVLVLQAGSMFLAGPNVAAGRNHTLNATCSGRVFVCVNEETGKKIFSVFPEHNAQEDKLSCVYSAQ